MRYGSEVPSEIGSRSARMAGCCSTRTGVVVALSLIAGCGFHSTSTDGGESDLSASGSDSDFAGGGGALDLSGVDGGTSVDGCATPTLLVLLRNANQSAIGGQVFQLSLATSPPQRCGTTIKNTIVDLPFAVAWIPPDMIAVGADTSTFLIDAAADQYRWNKTTSRVRDVFPIQSPQGTAVGIAQYDTSYSEVRDLLVLDTAQGKQIGDFTLNADPFLLGLGVVGMAQSPLDPSHVFACKPIDYQAADAPVPFDNQPITKQIYYPQAPPTGTFISIASVHAPGNMIRTAWVEHDSSNSNAGDAAYYVNDSGSGPQLAGPLRCSASVCGSPLQLADVVPDPTSTTNLIGICEASGTSTVAHVVRFTASSCEVLFDGSTLPSLVFPVRLALRTN